MKNNKYISVAIAVLVIIITSIILPCIFTMMWTGKVGINDIAGKKSGLNIIVDEKTKIDVENFIPCVVMAQMDYKSQDEALKAQMIVIRTRIINSMNDKKEISAKDLKLPYFTYDELQSTYGDKYQDIYKKLRRLISETNQSVIKCNGELINPAYHAVCSRVTRNGKKEYLKSVESPYDVTAQNYLSIKYYTPEEFMTSIKDSFGIELGVDNALSSVQAENEDGSEYVGKVNITNPSNGAVTTVSGDKFAKSMKLNSPCFIIEKFNEAIRIIVKGIGNGKGMSLYGAEKMAENGSSFKEILNHYYSNIYIEENGKVTTSSNTK